MKVLESTQNIVKTETIAVVKSRHHYRQIDKKFDNTVGVEDNGQFEVEEVAKELPVETLEEDDDLNDCNDDEEDDNNDEKDDKWNDHYDD